jgi:hypothetical protein
VVGGPSPCHITSPKEKKLRKTIILTALIFLCVSILFDGEAASVTIGVTGDWSEIIDASDLQAGPGSDLNPTYTSPNQQVGITIRQTNLPWVVNVNKSDTNWHPDFQLGIRRTTDGNGPGSISGGTAWIPITDMPREFFTGARQRMNIGAQLEVTGVSIRIPPGLYTTTIYYTVVEQ